MDIIKDLPPGAVLHSYSALDYYYTGELHNPLHIRFSGSLADIAREFEDVDFPGIEDCDAAAGFDEYTCLISCMDEGEPLRREPFTLQNFSYDPHRGCFLDPLNVYEDVKSRRMRLFDESTLNEGIVLAGAVLASRYAPWDEEYYRDCSIRWGGISIYEQRLLLEQILQGKYAHRGLRILMDTGFIDAFWPELASMGGIDHAKEHHPEGDVWQHTLETFRYRKTHDIALALGLLLHDAGKPEARRSNGNAFDRHAQIGSSMARRFLNRLGFSGELLSEVEFLVREHMLPAFIPKLPAYRTERTMSSPWFPKLLELYRCDLSSTFRGPDAYYDACKTYRRFLKYKKNPFRTAEGKKQLRLFVE